jgi:ParB/RepB/Spo0J family partition protein
MALAVTNPNAFPSDGKVLVVGIDAPITLHSKFMNRVYFWSPQQLRRAEDFPSKVSALVLSKDLIPGDERRIKEMAEGLEIRRITRASGLVRTEEVLNMYLAGVDLSIDPAEPEKKPVAPPPKPQPQPQPALHLVPKAPIALWDEEEMPPAEMGEVLTSLGYYWIPIGRIRVFEGQPREHFDQVSLALLAASISGGGQEEPVWVRRLTNDPNHDYELVDGERRYHSCVMINVTHMKAVFKRPKSKIQQYKLSVVGNFGQEPHPPLETARSIHTLIHGLPELQGMSMTKRIDALSHVYVKSPQWVTYHLSLLKLAPEVQAMMEAGVPKAQRLPVGMGAYLSTIEDKALQIEIAKLVVQKGFSVNQARDYARRRALELGTTVGTGRNRKPSDDYARFMRFINRTATEGDIQSELSDEQFEEMFKPHTEAELRSASARLEDTIETLLRLKKKVDAFCKKN